MVLTPIEKTFVYISRMMTEIVAGGEKHIHEVRYEIGADGSGGLLFEGDKVVPNEILRSIEKRFDSVRWSKYDGTWVLIVLKDTLFKLAEERLNMEESSVKQEKI